VVLPDSGRISRAPPYSELEPTEPAAFRVRDFHPLRSPFPVAFPYTAGFSTPRPVLRPAQPGSTTPAPQQRRLITWCRFGLFPVRSPLLRESRAALRLLLISSPPGTEMVQFPGSRLDGLCIQPPMCRLPPARVTPFGHPRISGCLLLPEAFRSLPRPSSPDSSKASTVDPCSLDHIFSSPFPSTPEPPYDPGDSCQRTHSSRPVWPTPVRPRPARPLGLARIELATSRLSGVRSNQLSYRPASALDK
jgi:hypothetical protein